MTTSVSPTVPERPWRRGGGSATGASAGPVEIAVTGLGSMPGTDPLEASRIVAGELPDFPFLPQLPSRGPASSALARTAGLLLGLPVDAQPSGWRLVDHPGRDAQRIAADLSADLDAFEEVFDNYRGPVKVAALGPLSVAAALEKNRGDVVLADHGARRDLTQSLAAGLAEHLAAIVRRVPGARPVLQLDDPRLASVLAGDVATVSGFGRLRSVEVEEARAGLRSVVEAAGALGVPVLLRPTASLVVEGDPTVSQAAPPVLVAVRNSGVAAVLLALGRLPSAAYDAVAELVEAGIDVGLGVVEAGAGAPGTSSTGSRARDAGRDGPATTAEEAAARAVLAFWTAMGFTVAELPDRLLLTPAKGLARVSPDAARGALRGLLAAGHVLSELVEDQR